MLGSLSSQRLARSALLVTAYALLAREVFAQQASQEATRFVSQGDGRLIYQTDPRGDRIPDFSYCGYRGGGVRLPDMPARVFVNPIEGDNTRQIQAAIDYVSQLPADERGFRGAVLLTKGRHLVGGS